MAGFLTGIVIFAGLAMVGAAISEFIEMKNKLHNAQFDLIEIKARLNAYVDDSARIQKQTLRLVTDIGLAVGAMKFDRKDQEKFEQMLEEAMAWNPSERHPDQTHNGDT